MPSAKWNGKTIAETDKFELVEGNIYFPRGAIKPEFFKENSHTTVCPWKGVASYFDVVVDCQVNQNAAWYYADPKPAAGNIKDHVSFWKGVEVTK
jgi:uncharacterized protein (DUF427 family)